jgi:stage III sporulation protein AB
MRIKKRPREIRAAMTALALLDTEIYWGATPLPEAFQVLEQRMEEPWRSFFAELARRLRQGEAAGEAWQDTIAACRRDFCLRQTDWALLKDTGKGLGRSDRDDQHKQLERIQRQLALLWEQNNVRADQQAKMWSYMGFMLGIAGAIILL